MQDKTFGQRSNHKDHLKLLKTASDQVQHSSPGTVDQTKNFKSLKKNHVATRSSEEHLKIVQTGQSKGCRAKLTTQTKVTTTMRSEE